MPHESWVLLARIVRPQGRNGEVLAEIFTDFPSQFSHRKSLFLRPPAADQSAVLHPATIEAQWLHQGRVVLKFAHVASMTEAELLRGYEVVTPRQDRMPLEGGAVYVSDLLGTLVIDVSGGRAEEAGEITAVEPEGVGPAMLVLRTPGGKEVLIPFVRAYLRKVDIEARRLEMDLPQGLLAMQSPAPPDESE